MVLPKSKKDAGLGRSIINRKARDAQQRNQSSFHTTDLINPGTGGIGLKSVTHQGDLEEFFSTAQLADADFTAERRNVTVVQAPDGIVGGKSLRRRNPFLLSAQEEEDMLNRQSENKQALRVPRRPSWTSTTTAEQLHRLEADSFLDWRRNLAQLTEAQNFLLTPFERNLEVWRQLWRVIERSHLVIQIVDARNPLRFRCEDLETYVSQMDVRLGKNAGSSSNGKRRNMLLINKADLLDEGQRLEWARYFDSQGIEYAFFSAANAAALQAARAEAEALEALQREEGDESGDGEEDDDEGARRGLQAVDLGAKDAKPLVGQEAAEHVLAASREQVQALLRAERAAGRGQSADAASAATADRPTHDADNAHKQPRDPTRLLNVLELEELFMSMAPPLEDFATEEYGVPSKLVVGLVGYPNVGKSSTINALLGEKKVSVSSTPGKTKHFQTINLSENVTLCDCPGLVFPQFTTSSADLVLDGVLPIDQMREYTAPADLLAQRMPKDILEGTYGFRIATQHVEEGGSGIPTGLEILTAYAVARGFSRQGEGNPDESRSARYVFKDYVNAKLLFAHPPPGVSADDFNEQQRAKARASLAGRRIAPPPSVAAGGVLDADSGLARNELSPHQQANLAGKKTRALDSAFFGQASAGVTTMGRRLAPGQQLRGKINSDGTVADGQQANDAAQSAASSKKHFKGKKAKQRSGHGYD
jgi:large subunit GTPase 1